MFVSRAVLTEDVNTYAYWYNTIFLHCLPLATIWEHSKDSDKTVLMPKGLELFK